MYRLLVVSGEQTDYEVPPWAVEGNGLSYNICDGSAFYDGQNGHNPPESEGVLLDVESLTPEQMDQVIRYCQHSHLPVLGVVPANRLDRYVPNASMDDFIVYPYNPQELVKRMDWVLTRTREPGSNEVVKTGDLLIDIGKYEVSLGGRRVILTYKEYQLLVLLATNPGRVYTRDELLQQVWGYDYFGGTRTVDVHIRRLRSKIEIANRSFIETIWNVGYRFRSSS